MQVSFKPTFGYRPTVYDIASLQSQYPDLIWEDATEAAKKMVPIINRVYKRSLIGAGAGLTLGSLIAYGVGKIRPAFKQGMGPLYLALGGFVLAQGVAVAAVWPQSKAWYAEIRNRSRTILPAWVDTLYGYKPSPN